MQRLAPPDAGHIPLSFALSPDGSRLVARTRPSIGGPSEVGARIRSWDTATGRLVLSRPDPLREGYQMAYSPDGRWLVFSDPSLWHTEDRILWLDAKTGAEFLSRKLRKGLLGRGSDLTFFSRDGRRLAIRSLLDQPTVTVWDTDTILHREAPEPLAILTGHGDDLQQVEFSPDNRRVLTAGGGGVIKLWDSASGHMLLTLKADDLTLGNAYFSPDGTTIWGGLDQHGRLWGWDGRPLTNAAPP